MVCSALSDRLNQLFMATYEELQAQIAELQRQAEHARRLEAGKVITDILATMQKYGITLEHLRLADTSTRVVKAKYRDPATGATWAGRGHVPKWMEQAIAGGKRKDDFLIK